LTLGRPKGVQCGNPFFHKVAGFLKLALPVKPLSAKTVAQTLSASDAGDFTPTGSHEQSPVRRFDLCFILAWSCGVVVDGGGHGQGRGISAGGSLLVHEYPGQVAIRRGLETEAEQINQALAAKGGTLRLLHRVAGDGEAGIENQINQMYEILAIPVDCIIIQPTDNAALAAPLRTANLARIPVVAYDQYISGGQLAAYCTSDNYQAGYLDGEYISSKFTADHEIRLVLVEYPHVSSTVKRVNGFLDALQALGCRYKILKTYFAVEPVGGHRAGLNILHDFPEAHSIDVIFTVNDGGGLAVVEALAHAGRREIMVATIDGDPASAENIRAGRLTVIDSAQFCGPLEAQAMKTVFALLSGGTPPIMLWSPFSPSPSKA